MSEQSGNWYCSYCGSTTPGVHIAAGEWRCPAMAADDGVLAVQHEIASLREQLAEVQREPQGTASDRDKAERIMDAVVATCDARRADIDTTLDWIASALAGERERCATVITPPNVVSCTCDKCAVRRECAAAIRAGGQEG